MFGGTEYEEEIYGVCKLYTYLLFKNSIRIRTRDKTRAIKAIIKKISIERDLEKEKEMGINNIYKARVWFKFAGKMTKMTDLIVCCSRMFVFSFGRVKRLAIYILKFQVPSDEFEDCVYIEGYIVKKFTAWRHSLFEKKGAQNTLEGLLRTNYMEYIPRDAKNNDKNNEGEDEEDVELEMIGEVDGDD